MCGSAFRGHSCGTVASCYVDGVRVGLSKITWFLNLCLVCVVENFSDDSHEFLFYSIYISSCVTLGSGGYDADSPNSVARMYL